MNKYSTDGFNNYKMNKTHNAKNTYYNSNNDVFINTHNTINTNDTYIVIKKNSSYNVPDNNYYTKKNFNTSNITNSITSHNHNNYGHNVIKQVHGYIKHINS